jgi:hypothetical protein
LGLRLFRDAHAFADALTASSGHLYSICNRDQLRPAEVLRLERCAADGKHRDLLSVESLRAEALRQVDEYFREAARLDRDRLFAYSSKVVLSIPDYQDLQKIFLLQRHFAANAHAETLLLVPDPRLRRLFAELFASGPPARKLALPTPRAWARFARTLLRALMHGAGRASARVLVFTLSSGVPRAPEDAYFGNLAETLAREAPTLTVYLASGPALRLPRNGGRAPFEAFVSGFTVAWTWLAALVSGMFASSAGLRGLRSDKLAPLHRYMRRTEVRSGEYFMQRLLKRGFRSMLERVSPDVLVYPFENRTWEKHLLAEAKAGGVGRRIAYQHSSVTPRHLAFHIEEGEVLAEHLPDRVVSIGDFTTNVLRKFAPALAGRVTTGVSLRTARRPIPDAQAPAVLVAISSSHNEALSLLQATHAAAGRVDFPFIVRTHPTLPIDAMFALFQWPRNVELSVGRSLADDLARVTMVAYSSSTVALEGMLYRRLPIFVDIGDLPSGDPIMGDYSFKFVACDGEALAREVDLVCNLDSAQLRALQEEARAFAENYLRAPSAEAVRQMVQGMLQT